MTKIVIVYHYQTGNTEKMALAVAEGALRSVERIALGYKFKKVYEPAISTGAPTQETLEACRNLGGVRAGGCQMGIF